MLTKASSQPFLREPSDGKAVFTVGKTMIAGIPPVLLGNERWIFLVAPVLVVVELAMCKCVGLVADSDAGVAQFTDLIPIHKSAELRSTGSVATKSVNGNPASCSRGKASR